MRKLLTTILSCGLMLGFASTAAAVDIKAKGYFAFGFGLYDNGSFTDHSNEEHFDAAQQMRTYIDFIMSEELSGTLAIEIGNTYWGNGGGATWGAGLGAGRGAGGAMGADGVSVEVKHAYIDWFIPQTDVHLRMGLQPYIQPQAVWRGDWGGGGMIFDDDAAGITLEVPVNDYFGVTAAWFRPWDAYINDSPERGGANWTDMHNHDEIDHFILSFPIEVADTFSLTPYGMFALVGEVDDGVDPATGMFTNTGLIGHFMSANASLGHNGKTWWAGTAFSLDYFAPFHAYFDFAYGKYTADNVNSAYSGFGIETTDPDRGGWVAVAKLDYTLDYFTPSLWGWYASGTDSLRDDGMDGLMPSYAPYFGLTSFGFSGPRGDLAREWVLGEDPYGKWAVGASLENIKFFDDLTSQIRVMYMRGTSDTDGYSEAFRDYKILDSGDKVVEVNFDNIYNIYENLAMFVEVGYIHVDLKHEPANFDSNAWKSYVGFRYDF